MNDQINVKVLQSYVAVVFFDHTKEGTIQDNALLLRQMLANAHLPGVGDYIVSEGQHYKIVKRTFMFNKEREELPSGDAIQGSWLIACEPV